MQDMPGNRWRQVPMPGFLCVLIWAQAALAQVKLPLEGFFRPGRCMPVWVEPSDSPLELRADGAVATEVSAGRGGVVPLLVLGHQPGPMNGIALRALSSDQRLVGLIGGDDGIASRLFPGQAIVSVVPDGPDTAATVVRLPSTHTVKGPWRRSRGRMTSVEPPAGSGRRASPSSQARARSRSRP